jgi:uncharacterized protein (DUF1015 family)
MLGSGAVADVSALRALHYDLATVGPLQGVVAPPYDVIDPGERAELAARSPYNVVHVDLPEPGPGGEDAYAHAAEILERWRADGAVVRDDDPALWTLSQEFTATDGRARTRRGVFARVRVEDYGPGRIRPHERTHPGPKEDRLRLTRATRANLSPIFSLYDDPTDAAGRVLDAASPFAELRDDQGTVHRLGRVADAAVIEAFERALGPAELLIADGHHRYETARVYADEVGGDGEHRHVLMCLVALQDPGLEVFPTHRLIRDTTPATQEALGTTLRELFEVQEIDRSELRPPDGDGPLTMGYIDAHFKRAFRLRLKDQKYAEKALADKPEPYRRLDTAVLEALVLTGPLGLSEDDISHLRGLGYSRTDDEALRLVLDGTYDAAFFLRATPVEQVRDVAATGVNMPPKSTFFFPKVPTGLLFNPLL